ncbi:hypothetical protein GCM10027051_18690 [Niabella terrae]
MPPQAFRARIDSTGTDSRESPVPHPLLSTDGFGGFQVAYAPGGQGQHIS